MFAGKKSYVDGKEGEGKPGEMESGPNVGARDGRVPGAERGPGDRPRCVSI